MQVLYKPGVQEGIFNLLNLTAEVVFARADRFPSMAAVGLVNGSAIKVLDQVCCSHSVLPAMLLLDGWMHAACFLKVLL